MMIEKPKDTGKTLGRLIRYIGSSRYLWVTLLVVVLFATLLNLAAPSIQGWAIDTIQFVDGQFQVDFAAMFRLLGLLAVSYLLYSALTYVQGLFAAKLSQATVRKLRQDLFDHIVHLPIAYTDTHAHGDLMSRMTNDVENISNIISQSTASLISGVLTIIGCLVIMLTYSPLLTLVSLVSIPLSIFTSGFIAKRTRRYFTQQQRLLGSLNGHAEEMITGYKTIVAYTHEQQAEAEFHAISGDLKKAGIKAQIFGSVMGPMMNIIGNLTYLLIAATGGYLALEGVITVGIIQAFLIYSKQFSRPITEIANLYAQIQTAIAGAERVFETMDSPVEIDEGRESLPPEQVRGDLRFDNLVFSYVPGEPVLKGLNLDVLRGQKIAIVGATGSGKTTIVNLLTRFYELDGGRILLDGVDIRDIPKAQLRRSIAIVLQDTVLFSDTIAANIRYGRLDATDEQVRAAAHTANADLFIERLGLGYETPLSESGGNLSQGQRQLLSIARAVLADPKILILDEATSSVDTRTELHIQQAMLALMENRTSLIIAHRLSTIRDADLIIVIDDGAICESGNHESLLAQKGRYYQLYQNQFAGIAT
ncbi:MAG: ABC transporter ATP-binding protein [Christensenellales bacterium]|jgi:ATP-binding cassette subfamily B multidrug efflux pump